ncbi:cohesin domain-containing protein [Duganella radicis]|uniref:General secretion pathway protein GspD n=1 Tax=Duganella radicis TaxID=551988 RepID=A0A6L6PN45_9BURK|nr:cohesin domain-containing protein [Duganella radicis]MTV40560.1 general secretion pathway protein GspD [Duganella radicis]
MKRWGEGLQWVCLALLLSGCAGDRYHKEGMDLLAAGKSEEGLRKLEQAVREEPGNVAFKSDYLNRRAEQTTRLLSAADADYTANKLESAEALYLQVQRLEPANQRALEGLTSIERSRRYAPLLDQAKENLRKGELERALSQVKMVLKESPGNASAMDLRRKIEEQILKSRIAEPQFFSAQRKPINLEFRDASLKIVLDALARSTGVNFVLDKDVRPDLRTTIYLRQATLEDAIELLLQTNRLEKKVLNKNSILIYANTPDKLKEYQELMVKGFYLTNADARQIQSVLKNLLKAKDISIDEKLNLVVIRDTPEAVRLAEKLIAMHDLYEPEVMLEVEVLEVQRSRLTELGVQWPNQMTLTPLSRGSVATLSDLRGLNSDRIGITIPSATVNLRREIGDAKILANPRIRARNREKAKIMIGDKVPVVNITTTSNGVSSESTQYLDVGVKLEVESNVYLQDEVAIKLALEVSSLVREVRTPAGSLAYQIGSRSASTVLRLKDGETQILGGLINDEDRTTASRVPGVGDIPMLGRLFSSQKDDRSKTEIVLSITPHLIRNIERPDGLDSEFWSGTENMMRTKPLLVGASLASDSVDINEPARDVSGQIAAGAKTPSALSLNLLGPAQAKVGEEFKVAVRLKSDGGVRSLPFQLGYDPSLLQVVSISEGPYFSQRDAQTSMSSNVDQAGGKISVSVVRSGTDGAVGEDNAVVLTMRALSARQPAEIKWLMSAPVVMGGKQITPSAPQPLSITVVN